MVHETRAQRRAERVDAVVDAALGVVVDEGFGALTMKRLADETGYAVGAVYRYFRGKDELLLAVQERVLVDVARDLAEAVEGVDEAQPLGRIVVAARRYLSLPERAPERYKLLARWLGDPDPMVDDELARPIVGARFALFELVPRLFAEASAAGALDAGDPLRRTVALWSALSGALSVRKLARFEVDGLAAAPLGRELVRALLVGWGADPRRIDAAWDAAEGDG